MTLQCVTARAGDDTSHGILGTSKAMRAVLDQVNLVASSGASVLVTGESGTGKELVARAIHLRSARRNGPFVPVNCAAIPDTLLESELFGHEKGAFTGADRRRRGLVAEADGGTLLLDEIGELSPALQVKLLRLLEDKRVRPVGGNQEVQVDFRLITATHCDLPRLIVEGRFREDLYYRLAVLPVQLPPLRERGEDILALARQFLARAAASGKRLDGFDDEARAWLLAHRWPGNVRELQNLVERAVAVARGSCVTRGDLAPDGAPPARRPDATVDAMPRQTWPTLDQLQAQYVERVLAHTHGNKLAAARILGISVRTLQRRDAGGLRAELWTGSTPGVLRAG